MTETPETNNAASASPVDHSVIRHYRVELTEAFEPTGFASAAIRDCMCCGVILSGMGGGGNFLCGDCLDKMQTGQIASALSMLERSLESGV